MGTTSEVANAQLGQVRPRRPADLLALTGRLSAANSVRSQPEAEAGQVHATLLDPQGDAAWRGLRHRLGSLLGVPVAVESVGNVAHVSAATDVQQLLDAVGATNPDTTVVAGGTAEGRVTTLA